MSGLRFNTGKIRWSLLSIPALTELVKVLEFGAKKYASWNWSKGLSYTDTYDSLLRHLNSWMSGEDRDPETGLSHMAHVMCNAMFLLHFIITGTGKDDRPEAQRNNKELHDEPEQLDLFPDTSTSTKPSVSDPVVKCGVSNVQADVRPTGKCNFL